MRFRLLVIFLIMAVFLGFSQRAEADEIAWLYNIDEAVAKASQEDKVLLAAAVTEWDAISDKLITETFNYEAVSLLSNGFICLQASILDKDFIKAHNITRYPTVIFLKPKANELIELKRLSGDIDKQALITAMKHILEAGDNILAVREKFSEDDLAALSIEEKINAYKELAEVSLEGQEYGKARDYYLKLADLDKDNKAYYLKRVDYIRALEYVQEGNLDNARTILEKLSDADSRYELARLYISQQEYDEAIDIINRFTDDYPDDERAPFLMDVVASYYFQIGRYKRGLDVFLDIIRYYPETVYAERAKNLIETMLIWPPRRNQLFIDRQVENKVIIAPDIRTYLYYISLWDEEKIYPVLIKGSKLNQKFINAFRPQTTELADEVVVPGPVDEAMILRALYTSFTDEDILSAADKDYTRDDIKAYYKKFNHIPLGVVLTRPGEGEMAGGLMLASARRQVLDFLPYTAKDERVISKGKLDDLKEKIKGIIDGWGYPYLGFLDGIDYITIAGDFPYAYNNYETTRPGRYAVDDALGREAELQRYAYVGRLVGNWHLSSYQAACSIFLQPEDILFFNAYSREGNWLDYRTDTASRMLEGLYRTANIENNEATLERWQILTSEYGNEYDLVFINSSGGPSDWNLSKGQAKVEDIPESVPAIVIYTHSNSAANPYDENTIAGRWLENGAYIYFGSISEPYVQSFKTPTEIVADLLFGRPYSQALRRDSGPWSHPWRLMLIGDPMNSLMIESPSERLDAGVRLLTPPDTQN